MFAKITKPKSSFWFRRIMFFQLKTVLEASFCSLNTFSVICSPNFCWSRQGLYLQLLICWARQSALCVWWYTSVCVWLQKQYKASSVTHACDETDETCCAVSDTAGCGDKEEKRRSSSAWSGRRCPLRFCVMARPYTRTHTHFSGDEWASIFVISSELMWLVFWEGLYEASFQ